MFRFRAFPNLLDDFLVSYRFAEILSQKWRTSGVFNQSRWMFPSLSMIDIPVLHCSTSKNHSNIWFGDVSEFEIDINGKNFGFQTSLITENNELLSKMNKYWKIDEEFIFPFKKEESKFENSVFVFSPAMPDRMLKETIDAWSMSDCQQKLKIFAPYWSFDNLKEHISILRKKNKFKKKIELFCPYGSINPKDLINEILKCSAIVDFRNFPGISFSTIVAKSSGMFSIGTDNICPKPDVVIGSKIKIIKQDGGIFHGKDVSEYSFEDLVNSFNEIKNKQIDQIDNQKDIISLFEEMIKG